MIQLFYSCMCFNWIGTLFHPLVTCTFWIKTFVFKQLKYQPDIRNLNFIYKLIYNTIVLIQLSIDNINKKIQFNAFKVLTGHLFVWIFFTFISISIRNKKKRWSDFDESFKLLKKWISRNLRWLRINKRFNMKLSG